MTEISDADKTQLLFKEFTGVTNVKQSSAFPAENFAFKDYIFGSRVFKDDIPNELPFDYRSTQLDLCGNIPDNSFVDFNTGNTNWNLRFYKKYQLSPAEPGSLKSWYIPDTSGASILQNAIPFKFDAVNSSYVQKCYRNCSRILFSNTNVFKSIVWLFDYKSGF